VEPEELTVLPGFLQALTSWTRWKMDDTLWRKAAGSMPAPPNVAGASRVRPYRRRPAAGFLSRGGSRIDHPSNVFVALKLKPLTFAGMQMQEGFQRLRV